MKKNSTILVKYLEMYKERPSSRVFAPLSEAYRKLGMIDEALKVLKEGLKYNPTYVLGYVVLANCYYDQEKYELTYNTLKPLQANNQDNISLQKLFADSCLKIGHFDEALEVFKYLLFVNPRDPNFQEHVKALENELVLKEREISHTQILKAPLASFEDDNWIQVDFAKSVIEEKTIETTNIQEKPHFTLSEPVIERSLDDDYFIDDEYEVENETTKPAETPLLSHTLVDLYISQNYLDKAHDLLLQYANFFPKDTRILTKLADVKKKMKMSQEDQGHAELMSIIENQIKKPDINEKLNIAYKDFVDLIKHKAQEKKMLWSTF